MFDAVITVLLRGVLDESRVDVPTQKSGQEGDRCLRSYRERLKVRVERRQSGGCCTPGNSASALDVELAGCSKACWGAGFNGFGGRLLGVGSVHLRCAPRPPHGTTIDDALARCSQEVLPPPLRDFLQFARKLRRLIDFRYFQIRSALWHCF